MVKRPKVGDRVVVYVADSSFGCDCIWNPDEQVYAVRTLDIHGKYKGYPATSRALERFYEDFPTGALVVLECVGNGLWTKVQGDEQS